MDEENVFKYHDMTRELLREFHIVEYVTRRHKYAEDRISEYARLYQQAYEIFATVGRKKGAEPTPD